VNCEDEAAPDAPAPLRGEILQLDDEDTGFSRSNPKKNRPYLVIGVAGLRVRVVPQSTDTADGVLVPEGVIEGLEEAAFVPWAASIPRSLALASPCIGHLPDPYLADALRQAHPWP
jgi:hypothetical protein